jgi:Cu2+-exporting ATPase
MDTVRTTSPASPLPARISWSDEVVELRDERVFGPGGERLCERFLGRALSVEGVCSISLDRMRATATIRHDVGTRGLGQLLERLSAAIRDRVAPESIPALSREVREVTCTISRHGGVLTNCQVVSDRPGRLHLRHRALRMDRALAREVEHRLGTVPGVSQATVGSWTSSLFVRYDPSVIGARRLLRLAEEALDGSGGWGGSRPEPVRTQFGLANATLVIAALADFVLPALSPVSAVLLVGTNIRTFRAAWQQLRGRRVGLPVLYTAIASTALASGQFVSCALMSLCYKFWHHRLRLELTTERRLLLHECLPRPRSACLITPDCGEVLVPVDRLGPGDRVVVRVDETVPADGQVIGGEGIVDERSVRGLEGAARKRSGDVVLAGSTVLAGSVTIQVTEPGERTRASSIVRALVAATSPATGSISPTRRTEAFANRAVGPALATAGVGLLIGDVTSAGAILAPDYATGPGLTVPLETLRNATLCARRGIVVRQPDAFERLAQVDLIVLDDEPALNRVEVEVTGIHTRLPESVLLQYAASAFRHLADDRVGALNAACRSRQIHLLNLPPIDFSTGVTVVHGQRRIHVHEYAATRGGLGPLVVEIDGSTVGLIQFGRSTRPEAAAALRRIHDLAPVPIALVSNRSEADVASLASSLGVDLYKGGFALEDTARFLRACRERGLRTAFVGCCRRQALAAAEAHVAISLGSDTDVPADSAAVLLLQPRVDLFADLWETARTHEGRVLDAQKLVLVPNVLCVAGAFFFGFTGLTAVMITNLGTFGLYNRAVGSLRELKPAGRVRSQHAHQPRPDQESPRVARHSEPSVELAASTPRMHAAGRQIGDLAGGDGWPTGSPPPRHERTKFEDPSPDSFQAVDNSAVGRIKDLPKEVGVMLLSVGVLGFVLPGVMGTPGIIAGGLVLWPGTFGGVEEWLRRRHPGLHRRGMRQLGRFLNDLGRRYPDAMQT